MMASTPDPISDPETKTNLIPPPSRVRHLESLIDCGHRFPTIYADPPWDYTNRVARGAASRHYQTMTLEDICQLPVGKLVTDDAHLHLWTTNGFLREAFLVIEAWGFSYRSCFVWVKPRLGCGNYWRVSHEFLLLGVRGRLPFRDRTVRSWQLHHRRDHSRKPESVRLLIEQVSPGPYLELFGRADVPDSEWTVFGNQVDRRLF